jgi:WD40 repeat protein
MTDALSPSLQLRHVSTLRGYPWEIHIVRFSPDGMVLVSVADSGIAQPVRLWNMRGRQLISSLEGHQGQVDDVVFSPDNTILAITGDDGIIRLWTREGKLFGTLGGGGHATTALVFSTDSQFLFTGDEAGRIQVWSLKAKKILFSFSASSGGGNMTPSRISKLALSSDGASLIVSRFGGQAELDLWKLNLSQLTAEWVRILGTSRFPIDQIVFSPDQHLLSAVISDNDFRRDAVYFYDTDTFTLQERLRLPASWSLSNEIPALAFSPEGRYLALLDDDGVLGIWNREEQRPMTSFRVHPFLASTPFYISHAMDWAQNGGLIATAGWCPIEGHEGGKIGEEDFAIKLWRLEEL